MSDWQYNVGGNGFVDNRSTVPSAQPQFDPRPRDVQRLDQMAINQGLVDVTPAMIPFGRMIPKKVPNVFGLNDYAKSKGRSQGYKKYDGLSAEEIAYAERKQPGKLYQEWLDNIKGSPRDKAQRKQDMEYLQRPENRPKRANEILFNAGKPLFYGASAIFNNHMYDEFQKDYKEYKNVNTSK